ncbi:hypothetical protein A8713_18440 [Streptomyces sp. SAT1]|uniref:hypothetical protein n=1 Tax=Streptomyces sp. SAT1 TaxID=1849967 RepID=UPI0007DD0FC9|nr:hypothetical protein [Streptomyces sp. SAT1]ANH92894.1 hypothetical protein A8713_18440 [Streptomyces sp. SAT1]
MSCSVLRKGRRSTVRAVLVGAAVAAAVLGPAAATFAATTVPGAAAPSATAPAKTARDAVPAAPAAPSTPSTSTPSSPSTSAPATGSATPSAKPSEAPYKEYGLIDGEEVHVTKLAPGGYRGDVITEFGEPPTATLRAVDHDASIAIHGMRIVLHSSDGTVESSWLPIPDHDCTATKTIRSALAAPYRVELSNGPEGPKARLLTPDGQTLGTVDRAHPLNGQYGMKIETVNGEPEYFQQSQGGDMPWGKAYDFPAPPACASGKSPATAGTAAQTKVVPVGAVAAGVQDAQDGAGRDNTTVLAGGAVALAGAAGVGAALIRRRRTVRVDS